jgi:hypothetical protein
MHRAERDLESRLLHILELLGPESEFDEVRRSAAERLKELTAAWGRGDGCESGARRLVEALESGDVTVAPPGDLLERLKVLLIAQAVSPNDYRDLLDFRDSAPNVFATEDMEVIAEQFLYEAGETLGYNTHVFKDTEEVEDYAVVAEMLGVEIDPDLIEQARLEVAEAADARTEIAFEGYRENARESLMDSASERAEMDALFSRLLD